MKIIVYKTVQDYSYITDKMEKTIANNNYVNEIWLWESKFICTAGTSAINIPDNCIRTKRGGHITYHNIGQRIIYFLMNLKSSVRDFIYHVNTICCMALKEIGVESYFKWSPVGIYYNDSIKLGSCGFRVSRDKIYHGIAININNDTSLFYNACGLENITVQSCKTINSNITMKDFDQAFINLISYF